MSTTMSSTIRITLPDASVREVPAGTTAGQIAESIGPGLARAALAARVNGSIWDLGRPLDADATVAILTERDPDALDVLRHSAAHILATAVRGCARTPDRLRPADRRRLLLRLRGRPSRSRPRISRRSRTRCGRSRREKYPFVREEVNRAEAQQALRRRSAQARAALGARRRRGHLDLHRRSVHRSLSRPARARHVAPQALQADCTRPARIGAATRSGRCCSASTAPRCSRRTSSTRTSPHRGGEASATTACSASSSTCS